MAITSRQIAKKRRWEQYKLNKNWDFLIDKGRQTNNNVNLGPYTGILNAWKNEPAYVVGSSAGLKGFDLNKLKGCHTIGINHIIEDFDEFEWFIFLDNRFLQLTTYEIKKFKGKIFQRNNTRILTGLDAVRFKVTPYNSQVNLNIETGLFNGSMTGLCALNLALIAGASPIYLLGCDTGGSSSQSYHYKDNYTGEIKDEIRLRKYKGATGYYKAFRQWKDRIVNVDMCGDIHEFPKIPLSELPIKRVRKIKEKTICHVISMDNMDQMGDISRQVFEITNYKHIYANINGELPKADIYFLECFINGWNKYADFKKPEGTKVISLIHSSGRCQPAKCSDKVITITESWKNQIKSKYGYDSEMIYPAIDMNYYKELPDYTKKSFGRLTRYSPGKVYFKWPEIANRILNEIDDSYCIMMTGKNHKMLPHERMVIDNTIQINEPQKKANRLKELTIFADMHNTFQETFSLCLLEAMAAGLCIVLYSEVPQLAMKEVLGNTGIITRTSKDFGGIIKELLIDPERKKEYGLKARERAKQFTLDKMVNAYNKLFKELI